MSPARFLTDDELGIPDDIYDALVNVVVPWLADGAPHHYPKLLDNDGFRDNITFDMGDVLSRNFDCGTFCCIGGAIGLACGMTDDGTKRLVLNQPRGTALHRLFMAPEIEDFDIYDEGRHIGPKLEWITPPMAHEACLNYLTTGSPNWEPILTLAFGNNRNDAPNYVQLKKSQQSTQVIV